MPVWLGIAIFTGIIGLIIFAIVYAAKEKKARKKVAEELGLTYKDSYSKLEKALDQRFPVFSKGIKTKLNSIIAGKEGPVRYFMAKYTYVEEERMGKKEHEAFGTVICFYHMSGNFNQIDDTRVFSLPDWNIEQDQKWAVIYPGKEVFKLSKKAKSNMLTAKNIPELNKIAMKVARKIA